MANHYSELTPERLDSLWQAGASAILPWGALEWHGAHLPLGLDGLVATHFGEKLAESINGVLLPTIWLPITTVPHRHSLAIKADTLRRVLDDSISGLVISGAKSIILLTGHYAQGHLSELYECALRSMDDHSQLRVFAGSPLEPLGDENFLDHAARFETSQLLTIRPDLVDLSGLPSDLDSKRDAVLGSDPREGSAFEGQELLDRAVAAWTQWVSAADYNSLQVHYHARFDALRPYVDEFYRGSWEDAIEAWWATK